MDSMTYAFDLAFDRSPFAAGTSFDVAGTRVESALTCWPSAVFGSAPNALAGTATKAHAGTAGIAMVPDDGRPPRGAPCWTHA